MTMHAYKLKIIILISKIANEAKSASKEGTPGRLEHARTDSRRAPSVVEGSARSS